MTQPSRRSDGEPFALPAPRRSPGPLRWRALLPAALLLGLLLVGLAAGLLNPATFRAPDVEGSTGAALLDGRWAAAYQRAFDAESALRDPAAVAWGVLQWTLFREGEPGVVTGRDGWLHTREEFVWSAGAEAALATNLGRVAAVRDRLAEDGVELLVVPLPAKARLHAETLTTPYPPGPAGRWEAVLAGLRERDLTTLDAAAALRALPDEDGAPFFRTDTHWTPAGASAVAAAAADLVRRELPFAALGGTPYELTLHPPEALRGDLTNFLRLGPLYERLAPPDDTLVRREATAAASGDLFGAAAVPVALVGTSYSADARWGFAGALGRALGAEVLNAAREGEGPFEPMTRYLAGEAFRAAPPEVIVWEIPERYLSVPDATETSGPAAPAVLP